MLRAELHLRVPRHLVVAVRAVRGDLDVKPVPRGAHSAELNPGVPQRIRPRTQEPLHHFGVRIGGEVQVPAQPTEDRIADAAAHQETARTRRRRTPSPRLRSV